MSAKFLQFLVLNRQIKKLIFKVNYKKLSGVYETKKWNGVRKGQKEIETDMLLTSHPHPIFDSFLVKFVEVSTFVRDS